MLWSGLQIPDLGSVTLRCVSRCWYKPYQIRYCPDKSHSCLFITQPKNESENEIKWRFQKGFRHFSWPPNHLSLFSNSTSVTQRLDPGSVGLRHLQLLAGGGARSRAHGAVGGRKCSRLPVELQQPLVSSCGVSAPASYFPDSGGDAPEVQQVGWSVFSLTGVQKGTASPSTLIERLLMWNC